VADKGKPETGRTDPKKGEPAESPVPKRRDLFGALKQAARDSIVRRTSTKR
jgi:hypothetical protein